MLQKKLNYEKVKLEEVKKEFDLVEEDLKKIQEEL